MQTVNYPFQIERISFFENDTQAQIEVRFFSDSLSYTSELILSNTNLNKLINALHSRSIDILNRLCSYLIPKEGKFFEIDLRMDDNKPVFFMPELSELGELKQIRA